MRCPRRRDSPPEAGALVSALEDLTPPAEVKSLTAQTLAAAKSVAAKARTYEGCLPDPEARLRSKAAQEASDDQILNCLVGVDELTTAADNLSPRWPVGIPTCDRSRESNAVPGGHTHVRAPQATSSGRPGLDVKCVIDYRVRYLGGRPRSALTMSTWPFVRPMACVSWSFQV